MSTNLLHFRMVSGFASPLHRSTVRLCDLPTPCLLWNVQALQRQASLPLDNIPSIRLSDSGMVLQPRTTTSLQDLQEDITTHAKNLSENDNDASTSTVIVDVDSIPDSSNPSNVFAFVHTTVQQGIHTRQQPATDMDSDSSAQDTVTILARLDAPHNMCAHLVLGLNNHHVGSYYWARSAGAGAAMEAPGILYTPDGCLTWQDIQGGPQACNSNDGKRSEWVGFLRPGDTVQLILDPPTTLEEVVHKLSPHIFGVSAAQRPLGSEPYVVCRYDCIE
jgi:hypothetical protein